MFKKPGLFWGLMLVAFLAVGFMFSKPASNAENSLQTFLQENQATDVERDAYLFALQHPEALQAVPCYCGCARQGHKSNLHCFIKAKTNPSDPTEFDSHGLVCPMCVQIALRAKDMLAEHKSLKEIRTGVDGMFASHPNLTPTPTPKP